ncbi:unnamed protein product [Phytophthora fragariaefolia]|uniref:Unnamed protein product n=1 Tax=Phytophthora fragariaefolia TaxID=1490495 RepID=A0A9W7CUG4_9STRA|nr:unnamed protein product [Phytophthora fragariaefolia]
MPPRSRWDKTNCLPDVFHTEDRLGDNMAARLNAFQRLNRRRLPPGRGLNLRFELSAYEAENRLLIKFAATGHIVGVLQRFGCVLDAYMREFSLVAAQQWTDWREELNAEREDRVRDFREGMADENWIKTQVGDEQRQIELLTLLKHDLTEHYDKLLESEIDLVVDLYNLVVRRTGLVLGANQPAWFLAPCEILVDKKKCFLHGVDITVVYDIGGREKECCEESCLRQAACWDSLCHPNIAMLMGACHIGAKPFFVQEPTAQNRANPQSWDPILGWGLALQYLHERGFTYGGFTPDRLFVRYFNTSQGVLCGLGLEHFSKTQWFREVDEIEEEKESSVEKDVYNFGIAICSARRSLMLPGQLDQLPFECPFYLNREVWALLQGMCAQLPAFRFNMKYVVFKLKHIANFPTSDAIGEVRVDNFVVPRQERSVQYLMDHIDSLCNEIPDRAPGKDLVHCRFQEIYNQLLTLKSVRSNIMYTFCDAVDRFLEFLKLINPVQESKTLTGKQRKHIRPLTSEFAVCCAARAENEVIRSFNHEIDEILEEYNSTLNIQEEILSHSFWRQDADRVQRRLLQRFQELLTGRGCYSLNKEVDGALLQHANHQRRITHSTNNMIRSTGIYRTLDQEVDFAALPEWFIPPYNVKLSHYVVSGSFADVYRGKWLDADVVVKVIIKKEGKTDQELFVALMQEVEHWAKLNHQNVLRMFGACHIGDGFIVCEGAQDTLPDYLTKIHANKSDKLWYLYQAALGLKYLHECGFLHDDLKGNNIMVGYDRKVKLIDFGLSQQREKVEPTKVLGAYRWKAPERLEGTHPTVESDVYSFGMCIAEILSDEHPWGIYPDAAVKRAVTKMQISMPKPAQGFENELHWDLIKMMCCRNPEERISMSAVVNYLYSFRFT